MEHDSKQDALFDFGKAVEAARRDFPKETKNTTFIDLDAPDADQRYQRWLKSLSLEDRTLMGIHTPSVSALTGSFASRAGEKSLVTAHGKTPSASMPASFSQGKWLSYVFDHELGHVVVKDGGSGSSGKGILSRPLNYEESVADGFAIARGFKNGTLDK